MATQLKQKDALEKLIRVCKNCVNQFTTRDDLDMDHKAMLINAVSVCYESISNQENVSLPDCNTESDRQAAVIDLINACGKYLRISGSETPIIIKEDLDDINCRIGEFNKLSDKIATDILEANDHCIQRDSKQNIKNSIMLSLLKNKYIID